jgi:D-alanyl-D-alanine carboxypeptidase (penicillin-binding protein 5/6)
MDYDTGRVLWEKNAREPMAMASTTKIMTALLVIESGRLGETAVVSKRAAGAAPVKMNLSPGEKIPVVDLLYALMLQSSNDAAVAVAEHIGGTVENFCRAMTKRAAMIGAFDTVFVTPNGLDSGDHHSTAYDMALITREALRNKTFVAIINTDGYTAKSDRQTYGVINKDRFLREFDGAIGVKTGFTGKAGQCFVGAARRGGVQLISVVLASGWGAAGKERKWTDTKAIMRYGFETYATAEAVEAGGSAGTFAVGASRDGAARAVFADGVTFPFCREPGEVTVDVRLRGDVNAPVAPGCLVGAATVLIDGKPYRTVGVVAAEGVERFDFDACVRKTITCWIRLPKLDNLWMR